MTRVAFFGMDSVFSVRALEALVEAGVDVTLAVRPVGGRETRREDVLERVRSPRLRRERESMGGPRGDLARAARARDIPIYAVGHASSPRVRALLVKERVALIVIAFFNQLLDASLMDVVPLGAVNAHPSLLPRLRGPAPLFWTYRTMLDEGGLSVHVVTPGEDDGALLLQRSLPLPFGTPGEHHLRALEELVGAAVVDVVSHLDVRLRDARPQDHALATRAPRPRAHDLIVDRTLGARRVFHFVRGFGRFQPLVVDIGGAHCRVIDAVDLDEERHVPADHAIVGDTLLLACRPGMVALKIDPAMLR